MEANVNQFEDNSRTETSAELQADSCGSCGRPDMRPGMGGQCGEPGNGRPCGRPNMRPGNVRPGMRPNMRPGMNQNVRPGMDRPCGGPGNGRPCGRPNMRPGNMRPGNRLPDGWRPSDGMRSNSVSNDSDLHSDWNCKSRVISTSDGISMVVGCEGQTMSGCHMNDSMERLGDAFPPVMAFVPWQQWGDLYDPECGLKEGTIFKDLNYIFCGTRC